MAMPNNNEEDVVVVTTNDEKDNSGENQDIDENEDQQDDDVADADKDVDKKNQSEDKEKADEDFLLDFKNEDIEDDGKRDQLVEALKNAKTTIAQKRHFREKLRNYEKQEAEKTPVKPGKATPAQEVDNSGQLVLELRQDNPWMSKDAAKEVVRLAKVYGESLSKTVRRPMVADWLKKEKNSRSAEEASIAPKNKGGGSAPAAPSSIAERDWSKASFEELQAAEKARYSR